MTTQRVAAWSATAVSPGCKYATRTATALAVAVAPNAKPTAVATINLFIALPPFQGQDATLAVCDGSPPRSSAGWRLLRTRVRRDCHAPPRVECPDVERAAGSTGSGRSPFTG